MPLPLSCFPLIHCTYSLLYSIFFTSSEKHHSYSKVICILCQESVFLSFTKESDIKENYQLSVLSSAFGKLMLCFMTLLSPFNLPVFDYSVLQGMLHLGAKPQKYLSIKSCKAVFMLPFLIPPFLLLLQIFIFLWFFLMLSFYKLPLHM